MVEKEADRLPSNGADGEFSVPTVFNNYGIARLNWSPSLKDADIVLVTSAKGSDSVSQITRGISRLGNFDQSWIDQAGSKGDRSQNFEDVLSSAAERPILINAELDHKLAKVLEKTPLSIRIVVVFDDPCSLALMAEGKTSQAITELIHSKAEELSTLSELVAKLKLPTIAVSAAKARMRPDVTAVAISDFIGLSASNARLRSAQHFIDDRAPQEQNVLEAGLSVQGALNRVQRPGTISGWVRIPLSEERLYVMVRSEGIPIADGLAEQYRDDLDAHNIGDGRHGFSIPIDAKLSPQMQEFEVVVPQYDYHVGRIQMSDSAARIISA